MLSVWVGTSQDLDAASAGIVLTTSFDSDVAILSPVRSPRVPYHVVVESRIVVGSITNSHDSVIDCSSAGGARDDSAAIFAENIALGIDCHCNWPFGDSSHELQLRAQSRSMDFGHSHITYTLIAPFVFETIYIFNIWIVCFILYATISGDIPGSIV